MDRQQGLPAVAGKKLQEYPKVVFEQFYDEADIHKNLLPSGLRIFLAQRNYSSLGISPWICLRSENLFEHPKNLPQRADYEFLEAPTRKTPERIYIPIRQAAQGENAGIR